MYALRFCAGLVALFIAFVRPAVGAESRVALVIGNATYVHLAALKTPSNDAKLVAKTLREVGFTEVLEHHNQDKTAFAVTLDSFATLARAADWALIYYAGHAVEIGAAFYLLPTDANIKSGMGLDKEGIPLGHVLGDGFRPRQLMVAILDCPRTNPFPSAVTPLRSTLPAPGDLLIAFATSPGGGLAPSSGDYGPFALSIVQRITVPGFGIQEVFDQMRNDVLQATSNRQTPWTHAAFKGRYQFVSTLR